MNWFRDAGLGVKLSLLLLGVLVVLLLSTIFLLNSTTVNLTEEVGGESIAEEIQILQSRLAEIQQELNVDINFIASSTIFFQAVGRRDQSGIEEIIEQANTSLGLDDIEVIDGDGNHLVDTLPGDNDSQKTQLLEAALSGTGSTAVLPVTMDGKTTVRITATTPVVSVTGNILGALQLSQIIDDAFLSDLTFGRERVYLGLVYDGQILARTENAAAPANENVALRENIQFDPASVQQAATGETVIGAELVVSSDVPHAAAYLSVSAQEAESSAVMMVLVGLDEIYAFQSTTLVNTIIVFAVLAVVTVGVIYLVLYRVAILPINSLQTIAQKMTEGQYDQRIQVTAKDEVGQLAATFNDMASAVQQREISLHAAREQAERADSVKSAFLASMSHELRTPLNAVLNFSQFLASGMLGSVNDEQIDMLKKITSSGKHLLNLINDVLDISKIEAGSLRLFFEDDVDLTEEVEAAADIGRAILKEKQVEVGLNVEIAPDVPLLHADRRRLRQILINLVSNACKFTEVGEITISLYAQGDEVCMSVKDTGPGIAPEDFELIFEAFRQTVVGIHQGAGTGLGLTISKRLAEAHGGRLWIESVVGSGSTFHVALPFSPKSAPQLEKEAVYGH